MTNLKSEQEIPHLGRGLALDVDGTLYCKNTFWIKMLSKLTLAFISRGITGTDIQVLYKIRKTVEAKRDISLETTLTKVIRCTSAQQNLSSEDVNRTLSKWLAGLSLSVMKDLRNPTLKRKLVHLRLRGIKIGIYSDYPAVDKLTALGFSTKMFDAIVDPASMPSVVLKPHPEGFKELAGKLHLPPENVTFFGDRKSTDGIGASAANMKFIHCPPNTIPYFKVSLEKLIEMETANFHLAQTSPLAKHNVANCWICGGTEYEQYKPDCLPTIIDPNLVKISSQSFGQTARLLKCSDCGFIRASSEKLQPLQRLYLDVRDKEYEQSLAARKTVFFQLMSSIIKNHPTAKSLLDVGACTGELCIAAKQFNIDAYGIEPSFWATEVAKKNGANVRQGYFPAEVGTTEKYDVITICDVIEHVSDPLGMLAAAHRHLNNGGLLVVVTPDIGSLAARLTRSKWWHFRPGHIGYFDVETMKTALSIAGFQIIEVSYYTWRFPIWYLSNRILNYFPCKRALSKLGEVKFLQWIGHFEVPLNLGDSKTFMARKNVS